jgi:hypothetical protein
MPRLRCKIGDDVVVVGVVVVTVVAWCSWKGLGVKWTNGVWGFGNAGGKVLGGWLYSDFWCYRGFGAWVGLVMSEASG